MVMGRQVQVGTPCDLLDSCAEQMKQFIFGGVFKAFLQFDANKVYFNRYLVGHIAAEVSKGER